MNQRQRPTKAMLLAAGEGTRLRPLTEAVAKCMVPINGKPVLEHTLEQLKQYGITDVMINLHYLPDSVTNHFGDGRRWDINIAYSLEPNLLGTAGAVGKVASYFDGPFFVWYGDNMSNCRLDRLWAFHAERNGVATIALHHREDPTQSGIVGLDENDRIVRFLEKPRTDQIFSHWVSAGIFVLDQAILEEIPATGPSDFGRDIFPRLLEKGADLSGYRMSQDEQLWWIDTAQDLSRVQAMLNERTTSASERGIG